MGLLCSVKKDFKTTPEAVWGRGHSASSPFRAGPPVGFGLATRLPRSLSLHSSFCASPAGSPSQGPRLSGGSSCLFCRGINQCGTTVALHENTVTPRMTPVFTCKRLRGRRVGKGHAWRPGAWPSAMCTHVHFPSLLFTSATPPSSRRFCPRCWKGHVLWEPSALQGVMATRGPRGSLWTATV